MTRRCAISCVAVALAGCSREDKRPEPADARQPAEAAQTPEPKADGRPVIVAFGDSLTAGLGVDPGLSYADFLQKDLDRGGYKYRVANQGISGDTTSGGVTRIGIAVSLTPKVVILELGANDGLRGLPVETTRQSLAEMIDAFQRVGAKVLLCGMTLPPNYGPDYIRSFEAVFRDIKREKKVTLMPFFLEGVATRRELMQPDGLHPTAEGNAKVAQNVMKYLVPLLK
jgi:acyl-CoA thioesterase-1